MSTIRIGLLIVTLILFYTPALAQEPQGPPSYETICHKYGTPAEKTLTLPYPAAMKHIDAHGDTPGECTDLTSSSSSTACPCFDDLTQVGFTDEATCTNNAGNVDIIDSSSGFLFAQASESTCGLAIGETEDLRPEITPVEGAACIEAINNLCATLPSP